MPDDQLFIQRRFQVTDKETGSSFSDAIILPLDEYNALAEKEIDQFKQARFDGWKQALIDAQNQPPPSKEDELAQINAEITAKQDELTQLQDAKAAAEAEIDVAPVGRVKR